MGGEFYLVAGTNASAPIAYNASASELAEAVNGMTDWGGLVLADRRELLEEDMFEWYLTFSPMNGNVEQLRVRGRETMSKSCKYDWLSSTKLLALGYGTIFAIPVIYISHLNHFSMRSSTTLFTDLTIILR